jgi:hypothetical protein
MAFAATGVSLSSAPDATGDAAELTTGSLVCAVAALRCRFAGAVSFGAAFLVAELAAFLVLVGGAVEAASGVAGALSAAAFGFLEEVLSDCMQPF